LRCDYPSCTSAVYSHPCIPTVRSFTQHHSRIYDITFTATERHSYHSHWKSAGQEEAEVGCWNGVLFLTRCVTCDAWRMFYTDLAIWATDGFVDCVLRYSGTGVIVFLSILDSIGLFGCLLAVQRYRNYGLFVHLGQHRLLWMRTCGTAVQGLLFFCRFPAQHRPVSVLLVYIVF
jgi:hypothetical protein